MRKRNTMLDVQTSLEKLEYDFRGRNLNALLLEEFKGETLLDVGCGPGHLIALAKNSGFKVFGIEPSRHLIELSKEFYKRMKIMRLSAEQLDSLDQKFDNVVFVDVLEHLRDPGIILNKVQKILNKDGQIIIAVPAIPFLYARKDRLIGHYRRYTVALLRSSLASAGFKIRKLRHWNFLGVAPYFFMAKLLGSPIGSKFRDKDSILNRFLDFWFKKIEKRLNLGIGLTIICVATKK